MINEIALLPVYNEHIEAFRRAFAEVAPLLSRAKGAAVTSSRKGSKHPSYST